MKEKNIELLKAAKTIAEKKYPKGFNKKQLIECSKEVNGGFSANPFKKIKTIEDVGHVRNHMALIDGNYPVGISSCEVVGINGGCGVECPVMQEGNCREINEFDKDEFISDLKDELGEEEAHEVLYKYDCFGEYSEELGGFGDE